MLNNILNFNQFNESMGTLSKDDTDIIEDLCLEFSEKWNLGSWGNLNDYEPFEKLGYISIQIFDKYHIQFEVQLYAKESKGNFEKDKFELDLRLLLDRISKFGFSVMEVIWGSKCYYGYNEEAYDQYTYNFQISHTEEKSNSILNESISDFYNLISEQDYISELKNAIPMSENNFKIISSNYKLASYSSSRNKYYTLANIPQYPIISSVNINISIDNSIKINELKDEWFLVCHSNKLIGYTIFYKCDQIDGVIKLCSKKLL